MIWRYPNFRKHPYTHDGSMWPVHTYIYLHEWVVFMGSMYRVLEVGESWGECTLLLLLLLLLLISQDLKSLVGTGKKSKKKTLRKTGSNPRGSQHIFRTFHFPSKMGKPATLIPKDAPNKKHFGNRDLEKGETHIENAHHLQVQVPFISKEFFSQVSDSLKNTTSASLRGSQKTNQFLCVILVHPLSPSAT